MNDFHDRDAIAVALARALPYVRLFKGKTFVLKAGGAMCADAEGLRDLAEQVSVLSELGIRVVLVHGGGPQTSELSKKVGLQPRFIEGRRVTCEKTLEIAVMTLKGSVQTAMLAAFRAAQVPAVGISGIDAALVKAHRRPPVTKDLGNGPETIDFGLVGDIDGVDASVLDRLLDAGFVPVISSLCADDQGQVLNINADTVASTIARALKAEKLVFLIDTPGILEDKNNPATLVSYTDIAGLEKLRERGCLDAGMLPKAQAAIDALKGGVKRTHMVGYRGKASLLVEVFTNEGAGTLVVTGMSDLLPAEDYQPNKPGSEAA